MAEPKTIEPLDRLRAPFAAHQISKLPKETKAQAEQRKADQLKGNWPNKCAVCGSYHHPRAVHLDYVGHAALTDRLLDVDPTWTWEPVAFGPDGLPVIDRNGGLWIKLTVCGVTRLGYGDADGKSGGNAVKEAIGDALRNAAMRFGAALDLWHKGDLHGDDEDRSSPPSAPERPAWMMAAERSIIMLQTTADCAAWYKANVAMLKDQPKDERDEILAILKRQKEANAEQEARQAKRADDFRRDDPAGVAGGGADKPDTPFDDEIPW